MKYVELHDGTRLEFPDNTPDSVIDSVVKRHITPKSYNPTDDMSWGEKALAGAGKAFVDVWRGGGQIAGVVPQQDIDEARKLDAALMDTGAGITGNVVGNIATAMSTLLVPGANTIAGGVAAGGIMGALQPTATGESRANNTVIGGVAGGVVPAAVSGFKSAKAALYDPFASKDKVIGGALTRTVGKDKAIKIAEQLRNAELAKTPGVKLSAGESIDNEALSALEDTLRNLNPKGRLAEQSQKNRTAMANAIRGIGGDDVEMAAAKEARARATDPLYGAVDKEVFVGNDQLSALLRRAESSGAIDEAKKLSAIEGKAFKSPVIETPQYVSKMPDELPYVGDFNDAARQAGSKSIGIMPFLRSKGGISQGEMRDLLGEKAVNNARVQVGTFSNNGKPLDDLVVTAVEGGYLPRSVLDEVDGGVQTLRDLIQNEYAGSKAIPFASQDDYFRAMALNNAPEMPLHPMEGAQLAGSLPAQDIVVGDALSGENLLRVKRGIDSAISRAGSNEEKAVLRDLKSQYMDYLGSQNPLFSEANKVFSDMSKPINQMQIGNRLSNAFIPATAGDNPASLNAASLAKMLRNPDDVARVSTGFKGARYKDIMTHDQQNLISGVSSDANKIAESLRRGLGAGSPTARRLETSSMVGQHFAEEAPVISKLIGLANLTPGVKQISGAISSKVNQGLVDRLDDMLATNPQAVADIVEKELGRLSARDRNAVLKMLPQSVMLSLPASVNADR